MMVGVAGLIAVQHGLGEPNVMGHFMAAPMRTVNKGLQPASAAVPNVAKTPVTMMQPMMEPDFGSAPSSSSSSACTRRDALFRAAGVAAAAIGAPAFAKQVTNVKMGSDAGDLKFIPADVTICKGDSITWTNNKAGPHNVQFESVPEGVDPNTICADDVLLGEGLSFTRTFEVAGTYNYYCDPHRTAGMVGEITVKA
jgi:plastocyanin